VLIAPSDPGAESDEYEDIIETDYVSPTGVLTRVQWGGEGEPFELPLLTAGPGRYRLRFHARGADAAADVQFVDDDPIDEYLLQIWPDDGGRGPEVVTCVSVSTRYWIDARVLDAARWLRSLTDPERSGSELPADLAAAIAGPAARLNAVVWPDEREPDAVSRCRSREEERCAYPSGRW
jgi:hypothetical protein